MIIQPATEQHLMPWLAMRKKLWPPEEGDDFLAEMQEILRSPRSMALLAFDNDQLVAFAELHIREYADGCVTGNPGYLEGIFVEEEYRNRGIASMLIQQAEAWFVNMGCREMASDAELSNSASLRMHQSAGFTDLPPVVQFVKKLRA